MKHRTPLAVILVLAALDLGASAAQAGESGRRWWTPRMRSKQTADGAESNKTKEKPAATAEQTAGPAEPEPAPAQTSPKAAAAAPAPPPAEPAPKPAATAVTAAAVTATDAPAEQAAPKPPPAPPVPDASLQKLIGHLRVTPIGLEPTAQAYLDLIGAGKASAEQVNDFAAYLAKRGMPKVALSFQEYALQLKPEDPTLWLNLGTIRVTNRSFGSAATAFKKSIALDPTRALAHYNLGAVYDTQKNYDAALEEYRRALVLDPELADPRKNPQVVNNENLLAVKLQIYQAQAGSLGLPLLQMQKPAPVPPKDPDKN